MDIKTGRNWGLFAAGIALVLIGFVLLMVPGLTLVAVAAVAGCMLLAAGIVDGYAYFKYRKAEGVTGWALAYAVCDVILGVLFIVHPLVSSVVIPWVLGVFVMAYGIFEIVAAIRLDRDLPGWGWVLFTGIASLPPCASSTTTRRGAGPRGRLSRGTIGNANVRGPDSSGPLFDGRNAP